MRIEMPTARACIAASFLVSACVTGRSRATTVPRVTVESSAVTTARVVGAVSRSVALAEFAAAVAPTDSGGECRTLRVDGARGPATLVVLSFPSAADAQRNVSVELDSAGRRHNYSDVRGDLRERKSGPLTAVLLDFDRGTAHATNEWPDRPGESAGGALDAALDAAHLGTPRRMLDLMRARCGTG